MIKYLIVAQASKCLGQPYPECPYDMYEGVESAGFIFGGPFYRWFSKLTREDRFQLGVNLLYKGGMPDVSRKLILEAEAKNVKLMSSEPEMPFRQILNHRNLSPDHISRNIRREVKYLFRNCKKFSYSDYYEPFIGSSNGNYVKTNGDLGTVGLLDELELSPVCEANIFYGTDPFSDDLILREPKEVFGRPISDYRGQETVFEREEDATVIDDFKIKLEHIGEMDIIRELALQEDPYVKVVGLAEPLKVRVISKGPPLTYHCLKPIQKKLHTYLRNLPNFKFIGKTINEDEITSSFGFMKDSTVFHSGDYSAATDEMFSYVSEVAWDAICDSIEIPDDLRTLGHRALTGHIYELDERYGDEKGFYPQKRGQLMGSILSFVVLCVVNYCAIKHVQWDTGLQG